MTCPTRAGLPTFDATVKETVPLRMEIPPSQLWSLLGANGPVSDALEGIRGSSEIVAPVAGSV
jgi:hypothetical protein